MNIASNKKHLEKNVLCVWNALKNTVLSLYMDHAFASSLITESVCSILAEGEAQHPPSARRNFPDEESARHGLDSPRRGCAVSIFDHSWLCKSHVFTSYSIFCMGIRNSNMLSLCTFEVAINLSPDWLMPCLARENLHRVNLRLSTNDIRQL